MGMFDSLHCEMPLPGPRQPRSKWFQTKDFDCFLDAYAINSDGLLTGPTGPMSFHGLLNFYTYEPANSSNDINRESTWFEYNAKFSDGKCIGIECVEIHRHDSQGHVHKIWPEPSPRQSEEP